MASRRLLTIAKLMLKGSRPTLDHSHVYWEANACADYLANLGVNQEENKLSALPQACAGTNFQRWSHFQGTQQKLV
ncbi:hypothetical protein F0562_022030 [Nyssa sinensis]|uniref:Uncharacterized protein n=1 Tax=Nyssa sinensis TaxID=561372 RepID=A0A5J5BL31_9ASTE|nr:hypothetical protein F0562_022030 [Nyssa sinensis]